MYTLLNNAMESFDFDSQPPKDEVTQLDHFHCIEHPLIKVNISQARRKEADIAHIRRSLGQIGMMLAYEALHKMDIHEDIIETPLSSASGYTLGKKIAILPILRAGLGLVSGIGEIVPDAAMLPIGMSRNEATLIPSMYNIPKLPKDIDQYTCIIADPMIATGGSIMKTLEYLYQNNCKDIHIICAIASPYGVKQILTNYPDVHIYAAALDDRLNEEGYIIPGMGDAGDRYCGT